MTLDSNSLYGLDVEIGIFRFFQIYQSTLIFRLSTISPFNNYVYKIRGRGSKCSYDVKSQGKSSALEKVEKQHDHFSVIFMSFHLLLNYESVECDPR